MAEFASPQETQRALEILFELQSKDPNKLNGILNKYANPFTSWPFLKEPTEAFLHFFETTTPISEQGVETIAPLPTSVDAKKLEDMVNVFNNEIEAAKQGKARATDAAQKFVAALVENAKRANVPMPESQAPVAQETEGTPLSPERVQEAASLAAQHPGPVEEKEIFFHALTVFSSEQPDKSVVELLPRAAAVTQAARVLSSSDGTFPREMSFSALATNDFQKTVAGALDRVVPPAAKESIVNRILLEPLNIIANHPENISKNLMGEMVDRWGENFVNSNWFNKLRIDANSMIGDQKGTAKVMSGFTALVSDVSTTVFRGPLDQNIITYIETYRVVATQGIQMTDFSNYRNISLGHGGQLVRMGADYVLRAGVRAGIKAGAQKAAVATAVKLGAEAVTGAATGGLSALAIAAAGLVKGVINKGLSVFKNLLFMGTSKNPEDNLLLVVGAGVVLVFFLPIFPLLNLPAFNQSMIDTSLATSMGGIGGGGPYENGLNCLDPVNKDNPDCKLTQCQGDCAWPLETSTHACIIEGPLVGTHSGCRLSGIDFIGPGLFSAPVHTPYGGVVTSAVFGYPDNSGYFGNQDGGTYGNHVIVKADNGAVLVFAHLRNIQMVQEGPITKNTVVGLVDNTGYSGGTHLHYEDMGAGGCPRTGADINKYLPYPVPPCLGGADCAAQMSAQGHSSCL